MVSRSKAGRPVKYSENMCQVAIDMMRHGASKIELAAHLGVNRDTISAWRKKYPDFNAAIEKGYTFSQAWWMNLGYANLFNKNFNYRLWRLNMINRFRWR